MKKNALYSLVFMVEWALYCLAVLVPDPTRRTPIAIGGLVLGSVFMWFTGWLLFTVAGRFAPSNAVLAGIGTALLAADLGAKALVNAFLAGGKQIALVSGWLTIRYAPNYSNNVLLNLLNITIESPWFHAISKLLMLVAATAVFVWYCKGQKFEMKESTFRWGAMLLIAGGLSSVIESAFRGYVLDFISFAGLVSFDIKDLCLMYSAGLIVITVIKWERELEQKKKMQKALQEPPAE